MMSDAARSGEHFRLLDDEAILKEPRLTHLVEGVCTVGGFVLVHGESNSGKTFAVLDLSFSVAAGVPWHGRKVAKGPVVYIAAEGHAGLRNRVLAWKQVHGMQGRTVGVTFLCEAVNPLSHSEIVALHEQLRALRLEPTLVVVDTWSASLAAGGGDEDRAKDAGQAAGAWRALSVALGATVLVVHHEGIKAKGRARGSSALRATADTAVAVSITKQKLVTLTSAKQRDIEPFDPIRLQLQPVGIGDGQTSCVLVEPADSTDCTPAPPNPLRAKATEALGALAALSNQAATHSQWHQASGQSDSTFGRSVKELVDAGRVTKDGKGQGALYRVVADHRHHHQTTTTDAYEGDLQPPPPTVTPLWGDSCGGEGGGLDGTKVAAVDFSDVATGPTMPSGKHQGEPVGDVPTSYLRWLLHRPNTRPHLREDIEEELARRAPLLGTEH
jgi:hypothetical protein